MKQRNIMYFWNDEYELTLIMNKKEEDLLIPTNIELKLNKNTAPLIPTNISLKQ